MCEPIKSRLRRSLWLLALMVFAVAACGGPKGDVATSTPPTGTPTPRPTPSIPAPTPTIPAPTVQATPTAEVVEMMMTHTHPLSPANYVPESLEERIYFAEVIVVASLQSVETWGLRFRATEYLKGTGPTELLVGHVSRNPAWDNLEAVLFLTPVEPAFPGAPDFQAATTWRIPRDQTVTSMWLPLRDDGAAGAAGARFFFTEPESYAAGSLSPAISLSQLRTDITTFVSALQRGDEAYDECVRHKLDYDREYRGLEAERGPWTPYLVESRIGSGTGAGAVAHEVGTYAGAEYSTIWLTGQDASLFEAKIADDDAVASTGYFTTAVTARPLPAGQYRFFDHIRSYLYAPCNFWPDKNHLEVAVTVTAPAGTLHEAFFDPAAIGTAVGADGTNGAMKPTAFTVGGVSTELQSLKWESDTLTLELSSSASLTGHALDFIALDGSVSLSLDGGAAAVSGGTLTWSVADQPWRAGDLLMLRIRTGSPASTPTATDR